MTTANMSRPHVRVVGGVCAGFAAHTGIPVAAVRTATLILTLCGGAGALLYFWLWATTPTTSAADAGTPLKHVLTTPATSESGADADGSPETKRAPVTEILLGVALLAAGSALVAAQFGAAIPLDFIVPAIIVLAGAGLAWNQFDELRRPETARPSAPLVRALGALVLVALGILLFFVTGADPNVWTVFVAATAVLLGVAVVVAPFVVRLTRDLAEERAARVREVERAEIAAHLHDSVLQTLALIQQKSEPHSEASRLARAQERELRDWLFAGQSDHELDLAAELKRVAAALEGDFAAKVEVVTTGSRLDRVPDAFLSAAREAMLNAARHAGGTISVYLESNPTAVDLTVNDRGPGFDPSAIPDGRFGVRESIIGRMQRIGGTARIRRGPGGVGTEVRLTLPLETESGTAPHEQRPAE